MYTLLEFDEIESTQDLLKKHYRTLPNFTIIRTNHQLHGRGQFERIWDDEPNKNILMSILLKNIDIHMINDIKDKIVLTLIDTLSSYGVQASFKAPNDLYVQHNKICGILIETKTGNLILDYAIIGIGLNVNQISFGAYHATSIAKILGKEVILKDVFIRLLNALDQAFKKEIICHKK